MRPTLPLWLATAFIALCFVVLTQLPVRAASPLIVESQAWWNRAGIVIPQAVGHHIHLEASLPTGTVAGSVDIPVTVKLHDQQGKVSWLRLCRESSNCTQVPFSLGPCTDCSAAYTFHIDVSGWPTGRQEVRLTANVADAEPQTSGSQRQFESSGWPLNIRANSPCPRCSVFLTARGWYAESHGYANAELESDPVALGPGGSFKVYTHPGDGGLPTALSGVYVDPDMHHGSAGIVLYQAAGQFRGSLTMPALSPGTHKLVIVSSDGQNAGVLAVTFEVH